MNVHVERLLVGLQVIFCVIFAVAAVFGLLYLVGRYPYVGVPILGAGFAYLLGNGLEIRK